MTTPTPASLAKAREISPCEAAGACTFPPVVDEAYCLGCRQAEKIAVALDAERSKRDAEWRSAMELEGPDFDTLELKDYYHALHGGMRVELEVKYINKTRELVEAAHNLIERLHASGREVPSYLWSSYLDLRAALANMEKT